jgi:fatty acid desaturase
VLETARRFCFDPQEADNLAEGDRVDHKDFVSGFDRAHLARLQERQDRAGVLHLLGHVGLIAGLALYVGLALPLWPLALLPLGGALVFLFTLEHEATHKTPFRSEWLNEGAGHASGFLILQPFIWFRYFHLAHHRFTNIPDKDPELQAGHKPEGWGAYVWHVTGFPYWIGMAKQIVANAIGQEPEEYVPNSARVKVRREARRMLALYGLATLSLVFSDLLFWIWVLPLLLGMPFLRLYLLAEHGRCAFVANMFENTRTTYTNRIVRFLAWNMPYHVEHHAIPNVPFHNLPALHQEMLGHHKVISDGYAAFTKEYVQDLRG